ncbi:MAG: Uma2 family endonuclease [Anaerolineae bacterium]|nr:Uma2 family endonuclease [Anaerolineae bacterium]
MVNQVHPDTLTDDPARHETIVAEGVSFEDFLKRYAEQHAEWLMGKVILGGSNNRPHQRIQMFLGTLVNLFLNLTGLGEVLSAGTPMLIHADRPAREPDLMVVLVEHRDRIRENWLEGPADIAVEIVSPESTIRDRGDKFKEYQESGVAEYWLIDPVHRDADFWALNAEGSYEPRPRDAQGRLTSAVLPGFALDPALLWDDANLYRVNLSELVQQMLIDS